MVDLHGKAFLQVGGFYLSENHRDIGTNAVHKVLRRYRAKADAQKKEGENNISIHNKCFGGTFSRRLPILFAAEHLKAVRQPHGQ